MSEAWEKMTLVEIKAELKQRGLPVSGNKSSLISRLMSSHPSPAPTQIKAKRTREETEEKKEVREEKSEGREPKPKKAKKNSASTLKSVGKDEKEEKSEEKEVKEVMMGKGKKKAIKDKKKDAEAEAPTKGGKPAWATVNWERIEATGQGGAFECNGEFLWGQAHMMLEAAADEGRDGKGGPAKIPRWGFNPSPKFHFRVAAKPGQWKVRRAFLEKGEEGKRDLAAFVVFHESADPAQLLKRDLSLPPLSLPHLCLLFAPPPFLLFVSRSCSEGTSPFLLTFSSSLFPLCARFFTVPFF